MRLQEIYSICLKATSSWCELTFEEKRGAGNITYYRLSNANSVRAILNELEPIISFSDNIEAIRQISIGFKQPTADINLDQQAKNKLIAEYRQLLSKVLTVVKLFESVNYCKSENGIDIKMPPQISLSDLSKCTKDLNTIFSTCPLFTKTDSTIALSAVDVGSIWLSFVIGGTATVLVAKMIAELVDKALIVRSHYLSTKEQEARIRGLELTNETLEGMSKGYKEIEKKLLDKVSNELAEEHNISDPEDIGRLKNSIQILSEWMSRGMEIYSAVESPSEVKAVFPPIEKQSIPENFTALLSGKNTESPKD